MAGMVRQWLGIWRRHRQARLERRALEDVLAKPHDHLLIDAGLQRDEVRRHEECRRLLACALWHSPRGGGL